MTRGEAEAWASTIIHAALRALGAGETDAVEKASQAIVAVTWRPRSVLQGPDARHDDRTAFEIMAEVCADAAADHFINVRVKHIRALLRYRPSIAALSSEAPTISPAEGRAGNPATDHSND